MPTLRSNTRDKYRNVEYNDNPTKRFWRDDENFDYIFTISKEKVFAELKDQNIFCQLRPYSIPEYMKEKSQFCIFHNDHSHTLASWKNLYNQIKSMTKKGELLKYMKKKIPTRLRRGAWSSRGLVVKVMNGETSKKGEAGG